MWRGISLANKCLLLFGAAVVLIILAALAVPLIRLIAVVDETQKQLSSDIVEVWQFGIEDSTGVGPFLRTGRSDKLGHATIELLTDESMQAAIRKDEFAREAHKGFVLPGSAAGGDESAHNERHSARWSGTVREYRYAKAVRDPGGELVGMVIMTRPSTIAWEQAKVNLLFLGAAGLVALGLAVGTFYLITNKLILSPVRDLRETAELVREGNLGVRADIQTGDEFEDLAGAFNQMLDGIRSSQEQLRAINTSLDLKLREVDARNVALFEANKLKGDFLASVSHELRTPLNSIIGFAELLGEAADRDQQAFAAALPGTVDDAGLARLTKRRRYLDNILNSGRSLLEMINGLLEMAKVEAGKMDLQLEDMNVHDACEGLVALIRPLADRGGVELSLDTASDTGNIRTDPRKFQQIVFNLLSNAVKFTSEKAADERTSGRTPTAKVILRAERIVGRGSEGLASTDRVRVSVLDTGPGISPEDQKKIFQKFQQLDTGHTRRHAGTGLGLAICKELTSILQGEIQVESEAGRGSMFSVLFPLDIDPGRADRMREELADRAAAVASAQGR
jgi:two-component system, NarL family, sensor histidine kinase BarA